jgi:hypothetical protein
METLTMRFRIERLEERIAPSHAGGFSHGNQTQIAQGIGNGNGPHNTSVTLSQDGSADQLQSVSGIGNGNGPHTTVVTLIQNGSPAPTGKCGCW